MENTHKGTRFEELNRKAADKRAEMDKAQANKHLGETEKEKDSVKPTPSN